MRALWGNFRCSIDGRVWVSFNGEIYNFLAHTSIVKGLLAESVTSEQQHYMIVERLGTEWRIGEPICYWRLPEPRAANNRASPQDLARGLVERLKEAVRLRLISDVSLSECLWTERPLC